MRTHAALAVVACLMLVSSADAQRRTLEVGADAPALDIKTWVQGEQTTLQRDNVYVIEFWATWCGPCRAAIPHLNELQRHYEADGLRVIGVTDENEQTVRSFLQGQGSNINYTIAIDNNKGTSRAWMNAAGLNGIPASFIVDDRGKIQFIGNPHDPDFPRILDMVIHGRYDAKLFREARPMLQAADRARNMRNWRQVFAMVDQIIEVDNYIFAPLELDKFRIMMVDMEDPDAAYRHAREVKQKYADDSNLLLRLGELIATDPAIPNDVRDLDLALELVNASVPGFKDRNDPRLLAVQAKVHFHRGDAALAATLQRRAWMIARPERKARYERVLRTYQTAAAASEDGDTPRSTRSFRR